MAWLLARAAVGRSLLPLVMHTSSAHMFGPLSTCPNAVAPHAFLLSLPSHPFPLPLQDAFTAMTWVNLTANANGKVAGFVDWGWAVGACHKSSCDGLNLPDQAIFATMYEKAGDWDTAWDPDVMFVRSDDWFKTIKQKVRVVGSDAQLTVGKSFSESEAWTPWQMLPGRAAESAAGCGFPGHGPNHD